MTEYYFTFKFADPEHEYKSVAVAGSFNGWKPATKLVFDDSTSTWQADITTSKPKFTYKYVVDGDTWVVDQQAPIEKDVHGNPNNTGTAVSSDPSQDRLESDVAAVVGGISAVNAKQVRQERDEYSGLDKQKQLEGDVNNVVNLMDAANKEKNAHTKADFEDEADAANYPGAKQAQIDADLVVGQIDEANAEDYAQTKREFTDEANSVPKDQLRLESDVDKVLGDYEQARIPQEIHANNDVQLEANEDEAELKRAQEDADLAYAAAKGKNAATHADLQKDFKENTKVPFKQTESDINKVVADIDAANAADQAHTKADFTQDQAASDLQGKLRDGSLTKGPDGSDLPLYAKVLNTVKWFIDYYVLAFFRH